MISMKSYYTAKRNNKISVVARFFHHLWWIHHHHHHHWISHLTRGLVLLPLAESDLGFIFLQKPGINVLEAH